MISFLFVCAGNICRSPALVACLQKLVNEKGLKEKVFIDSCALTPSFLGAPADPRIVAAAHKRGVHIDHKAKLFEQNYFKVFNYILAVNHESLKKLQEMAHSDEERAKIHLASEYSTLYKDQDMADPYFNGDEGFEKVLDMAEEMAREIFAKLVKVV